MFLTTENYKEFLGKKLDATPRRFHYYPLEVIEINGEPYYKDRIGVYMHVPEKEERFNTVYFDRIMEDKIINEQKVKNMICREILNYLKDYSAASALREILFNDKNKIDWNSAYESVMQFMPELKQYEGYSEENMK